MNHAHPTPRRFLHVGITVSCLSLLLLAGCGKAPAQGGTGTPPAGQQTSATQAPSAPATPEAPSPLDAPTEPPQGDKFTFDQAARYSDGVLVEVSTISRAKATPQQHGAEGTDGTIAVAEILFTNKSSQPFDTESVLVTGYYGDVGAPKILDESKKLGDSFTGVIKPGGQAKATMGFAIPADAMGNVTIMVDANTPDKSAVQFNGAVS